LLCKKRLTTAKLLLKITDLPVEEIARSVGFPDQNYFYRKFSAVYGTTPGKYRKEVRS
jgi:AraC-like DNA-binding protein